MIIESIGLQPKNTTRDILFLSWARTPPKGNLAIYPQSAKALGVTSRVVALIDDLLPVIRFNRSKDLQDLITEQYVSQLPSMGFSEVVCLSQLGFSIKIADVLFYCRHYSLLEAKRIIPKSKKEIDFDYNLGELVEFCWQLHVLKFALDKCQCSETISGIKTKFFYLAARKVLKENISMHFVGTLGS